MLDRSKSVFTKSNNAFVNELISRSSNMLFEKTEGLDSTAISRFFPILQKVIFPILRMVIKGTVLQ